MTSARTSRAPICLALLALSLPTLQGAAQGAPEPAAAGSGAGDLAATAPAEVVDAALACSTPWAELRLVARKGPLRARIEVKAATVDGEAAARAMRELAPCPDADGRVSVGACVVRIDSVTDAPFSAPRRTTEWLDLGRGTLQLESFQGSTHSLHRDCAGRRHSSKWRVRKHGEELQRTRVREAGTAAADRPIVDGSSLAWFASAHRLDRAGSHLEAAAWSGDRLVPIRLEAREIVSLPCRDGRPSLDARRVTVTAEPTGDDDEPSVAPFGLSGDVSLWLEAGTARILAIEGDSVKIGHVRAVNTEAGVR